MNLMSNGARIPRTVKSPDIPDIHPGIPISISTGPGVWHHCDRGGGGVDFLSDASVPEKTVEAVSKIVVSRNRQAN